MSEFSATFWLYSLILFSHFQVIFSDFPVIFTCFQSDFSLTFHSFWSDFQSLSSEFHSFILTSKLIKKHFFEFQVPLIHSYLILSYLLSLSYLYLISYLISYLAFNNLFRPVIELRTSGLSNPDSNLTTQPFG